MEKETETVDSPNDETTEESSSEETEVAHKESELTEKNRQLFERAKKAETEAKELREKLKSSTKTEETVEAKPESQSNEPDYARLAFLNGKGIEHADDIKVVMDEAKRLKLPLTDVLGMKHIQIQLQDAKDDRTAKAGMPKGKGRTGGNTQNDVDYWLSKGETPDDQELAEKVVNARMKKETSGKMFSDTLY